MSSIARPESILVRCRRFEVVVTLDPFGGLSPLEEHLLLAVTHGESTVEALGGHLRLPRRLVLDACVDLLQTGLLVVAQEGTLEPNRSVRDAIGRDPTRPKPRWKEGLDSSSPPQPETMVLLQELLSGALFAPLPGPGHRPPSPLQVPIHPDVSRLEDVPKLDIFLALGRSRRVRRDEDNQARPGLASRPSRIRDARLLQDPRGNRIGSDVKETSIAISLLARHGRSTDDPPLFKVVGPDAIPAAVRRRMAVALTDLWLRGYARGSGQFFDRLRCEGGDEDESGPLVASPHPRRAVERLRARWESEREQAPIEIHDALSEQEREVWEELCEVTRYGAGLEFDDTSTHRQRLLEALAAAKRQVVVIGARGLVHDKEVIERLKEAAERGVMVLLAGIVSEDRETLTSLFERFSRTKRGGAVMVAECLMKSGARVIVCDLNWAHLTSGKAWSDESSAVGIRIRGPEREPLARAIPELLEWLRGQLAAARMRPLLLASPTLFGKHSPTNVEIVPEVSAPPEGTFAALWPKLWSQRIDEHEARLVDALPLAVPVFDGDHLLLMRLALDRSEHRISIESADLGSTELSSTTLASLAAAAARGVEVRVKCPTLGSPNPEISRRRQDLEAAGVKVMVNDTQANLLVCDDWCLIGSYRYLQATNDTRRELSLRIFDDELVDRIFTRCDERAGLITPPA